MGSVAKRHTCGMQRAVKVCVCLVCHVWVRGLGDQGRSPKRTGSINQDQFKRLPLRPKNGIVGCEAGKMAGLAGAKLQHRRHVA